MTTALPFLLRHCLLNNKWVSCVCVLVDRLEAKVAGVVLFPGGHLLHWMQYASPKPGLLSGAAVIGRDSFSLEWEWRVRLD